MAVKGNKGANRKRNKSNMEGLRQQGQIIGKQKGDKIQGKQTIRGIIQQISLRKIENWSNQSDRGKRSEVVQQMFPNQEAGRVVQKDSQLQISEQRAEKRKFQDGRHTGTPRDIADQRLHNFSGYQVSISPCPGRRGSPEVSGFQVQWKDLLLSGNAFRHLFSAQDVPKISSTNHRTNMKQVQDKMFSICRRSDIHPSKQARITTNNIRDIVNDEGVGMDNL
ncbi:MAG: hypothetical protein EZS28_028319, partial [Streblomastix strix]